MPTPAMTRNAAKDMTTGPILALMHIPADVRILEIVRIVRQRVDDLLKLGRRELLVEHVVHKCYRRGATCPETFQFDKRKSPVLRGLSHFNSELFSHRVRELFRIAELARKRPADLDQIFALGP